MRPAWRVDGLRDAWKSEPQPPRPAPGAPPTLERIAQLANQNNPTAQTIIGIRAQGGTEGGAANPAEAFRWLSRAAQQGQPVAEYRLGTLYERGQGVPADGAQAAHWYEMAANQGNRKAMHNLAVAYAGVVGGKKNMAEAARWFAKAAALGLSDSQFNLAVLYERGDGVPQSLLDAYKWYSIAAATPEPASFTPDSFRPISQPESAAIRVRSLQSPRWPMRNMRPLTLPRPVPSDRSKRS